MLLCIMFTELELPIPTLPVFDLSGVVPAKQKKKNADEEAMVYNVQRGMIGSRETGAV